jgi:hypothetical protein
MPQTLQPSIVNTPQGSVTLLPPTRELLRSIRDLLPMGIMGIEPQKDGAAFGIVMQCEDQELWAIKQQPVECSPDQAPTSYTANTLLVAGTFHRYFQRGFGGLLLPCPYMRDKGTKGVEAGIAYFAYPSPQGREATADVEIPAFDRGFGKGFTAMLSGFINDLEKTSTETGITLFPAIGLEPRPRLQLGTIGFAFMVVGNDLVCLKTVVSEEDPAWTMLRSTGIDRVYHMPSLPYGICQEDLRISKPNLGGNN